MKTQPAAVGAEPAAAWEYRLLCPETTPELAERLAGLFALSMRFLILSWDAVGVKSTAVAQTGRTGRTVTTAATCWYCLLL